MIPVRWKTVAPLLIVAAAVLAWSNSLSAPFEFDDHASILDNTTIRRLVPPAWLQPPATAGETVSGRPLLNFTFALNYALGELDVRGYRAVNVLVHALAGLVLFGIVRRTRAGDAFALGVALLWVLHPLQTAAVTYVVQRAESLAAFFVLLSLYGFIRGASTGSAATPGRPTGQRPEAAVPRWFVLSFVAAVLGVLTKETAGVAPVLILLYDRTFLAGGFRAAWRARRRVHAALFATWLPLAALVLANRARGGSAGVGTSIDTWTYALTQCGAIVRYLALAFWPVTQVFDYGVPTVSSLGAALPVLLFVVGCLALAAWALRRNHPAGFLGAAFFLALAPSSSVVPIATQTMAEHRLYLALAALIVLACAGGRALLRQFGLQRLGPALISLAVVALGAGTFARNQVYRSEISLWQDTVAKRPDNPRARHNLGAALLRAGRIDEAATQFRAAVALQPHHAYAHYQLGAIRLGRREWAAAAAHLETALQADPHYVAARIDLAQALAQLGRTGEAIAQNRAALADEPGAQDARTNLAALLLARGEVVEAIRLLREAIAAAPALAEAHYHLGLALEKSGIADAAVTELREAARLKPSFAPAQLALGNVLAHRGDAPSAETCYRETLRLDPRSADAHYALGNLLAQQRRFDVAMAEYRAALALDSTHLPARTNLANCQLVTGRFDEAIANYEAVLRVKPGDEKARANLSLARELRAQRK